MLLGLSRLKSFSKISHGNDNNPWPTEGSNKGSPVQSCVIGRENC